MAYSSIIKPSDYFNTKLHTGTGSASSITGVGFQPDMVWSKQRNGTDNNNIIDAVRGVTKIIQTDTTTQEQTASQSLTSFDSDGFSVGTDNAWNGNSNTYCMWNWRASGTSGSSNTDGSITSTVSASTTSGFSIVKYTGTGANASIGTGLGAIPHMAIFKRTDTSGFNWFVYHRSLGAGQFSILDTTGAAQSSTSIWQNTTPTSSVITLGGDGGVNASGGTYICYAFAEKKGYSKFSSYSGNGSNDGSFTYTGFKPAFVMIKSTDTESWYILDTKRPGYNTNNYYLLPNTNGAEGTSTSLATSLLSNGFKIENSDTSMNTSGQTYIYMAFAEHPFVSNVDGGLPTTAR